MPRNIGLEAQIDPDGTQLWTDGESHLFLRLKSKELLAPASRPGVFNIYGMCHELGHIAMYHNLKSLMGLPPGVAEGWAHYAGSIVVTEVAAKLGKSIWPEYYDIAAVEGVGRLQNDSKSAKPWDKMHSMTPAALVFYRIEIESGRDKLAAAMSAALAERPAGKDLMPLVLEKLRQATSNPTSAAGGGGAGTGGGRGTPQSGGLVVSAGAPRGERGVRLAGECGRAPERLRVPFPTREQRRDRWPTWTDS